MDCSEESDAEICPVSIFDIMPFEICAALAKSETERFKRRRSCRI